MNGTKRTVYFVLGWVMVALGFVGALLPIMPTTIFLILAVWCLAGRRPALKNGYWSIRFSAQRWRNGADMAQCQDA